MEFEQIIEKLESLKNPDNVKGMARFGINPDNNYGLTMPILRKIAKETGKNHELALKLWNTGIHDCRILAPLVEIPELVSPEQMDCWVKDFNSWDVCDQCCLNLFHRTKYAYDKVHEWCRRDEEYVKRAGFALMAVLAVHDKKADDTRFIDFLPYIVKESIDERNFVKKAVNWALRQIGKRNYSLREKAIETSEELLKFNSKSAKWIAADALRELTSEKIIKRIKK